MNNGQLSLNFTFAPAQEDSHLWVQNRSAISGLEVLRAFLPLKQAGHLHVQGAEGSVSVSTPLPDSDEAFRIHLQLPFEPGTIGSQMTDRDSQQFDKLVDFTRVLIDQLVEIKLYSPASHEVELVLSSQSSHHNLPYWKLGSDVGISCLISAQQNTHALFFNNFKVWDPFTISWLTTDSVEQLEKIEALSARFHHKNTTPDLKVGIIEKVRNLDRIGLIQELSQGELASAILLKSRVESDRIRAEEIRFEFF